jgi:hypothetical protein
MSKFCHLIVNIWYVVSFGRRPRHRASNHCADTQLGRHTKWLSTVHHCGGKACVGWPRLKLRGWLAAVVGAELVPCFLVGGPAAGGVGGVEHDCGLFAADDSFCGDYVPEVFGDYVGGEVIEVSALVGQAAGGVDVAAVASFGSAGGGGLDLHAHEVAVGFDDGVVGGRLSPGIEDLEAMFGGCGYEL